MMGAVLQPGHQVEIEPAHDASGLDVRARAAGLIRDGRMEEASALLAQGRGLFPDDVDLLLDQASLAEAVNDPDDAVELLETAIDRDPAMQAAYLRAGILYRKIGRPREAETILLEGMCRFPSGAELYAEYAAIAVDRQDWRRAARRYRLACERFPSQGWPHVQLATALRRAGSIAEAEAVLLAGQRVATDDPALFGDHAELASERRDWTEGLRRFEIVRDRFPDTWWAYKRIADMLRAMGRNDEAETVLLAGQRMAPGEPALFGDHAELASERRDWAESLRRFEIVRDRFPGTPWSYKRIADTLRAMDRPDEAEAVLLEGQRQAPGEPALFGDHADLAFERFDWAESLRRFEIVRDRFPGTAWSYRRIADTLRRLDRTGEAEVVLIDAMEAFPQDPTALIELCRLTGQIAAEDRRVPLAELGRMVADRIQRDGETLDLLYAMAQLAQIGGDYQDHLRQLMRIGEIHPNAPELSERIVAAREVLLGIGEADGAGAADPAARPPRSDDLPATAAELFALFESLGGGGPDGSGEYGCEFGFAQRKLEIEPLSLLRWTGVTPPNLIRLLDHDFEGVGDPRSTLLVDIPTQADWHATDTRYGLYCAHTHLARLAVPMERAQKMMCQRMGFLARKLREDLGNGEKIFVYRYAGPIEDEAEVLALARAVNGFGPNVLLFVCRADERHPPFTVRQVQPGLLVGHLDWFAQDRFVAATGFPANMTGWTRICEAAYRLWRSAG